MKKASFDSLIAWENENGLIKPSRSVTIKEQILMFLLTISQGLLNRANQERLQHSGDTVSQ
jgi:hypothetical protein